MSSLRQIRAIALLPGTVAGVVPAAILLLTRSANAGWALLPSVAGLLLAVVGLALLYQTTRLFVTQGHGTLAPWDPTQRIVIQGIYRNVRNPMISGIFSILLGEALFFGSRPLGCWFLLVVLINLIYIPLSEEPGLERRFGESYRIYKQHVPRWIPRLKPWNPPWDSRHDY